MENRNHLTKMINIQEHDLLIDQSPLTIGILISYSSNMYFRDSIETLSPGTKHHVKCMVTLNWFLSLKAAA